VRHDIPKTTDEWWFKYIEERLVMSQYARENPEAPEPFEDIAERADEMRKEFDR
jgi:hypothetical protein